MGFFLGKTTVSELARLGKRAISIDKSTGQPYLYYTINGQNVWYDERSGLSSYYHISSGDMIPLKWWTLGMLWDKSYNQWIALADEFGWGIKILNEPTLKIYNGRKYFHANVIFSYNADGIGYSIELDFYYSKGLRTSDKNTLSSIGVSTGSQDEIE